MIYQLSDNSDQRRDHCPTSEQTALKFNYNKYWEGCETIANLFHSEKLAVSAQTYTVSQHLHFQTSSQEKQMQVGNKIQVNFIHSNIFLMEIENSINHKLKNINHNTCGLWQPCQIGSKTPIESKNPEMLKSFM